MTDIQITASVQFLKEWGAAFKSNSNDEKRKLELRGIDLKLAYTCGEAVYRLEKSEKRILGFDELMQGFDLWIEQATLESNKNQLNARHGAMIIKTVEIIQLYIRNTEGVNLSLQGNLFG